jgi:cob(I)alamin adenosyltransferase
MSRLERGLIAVFTGDGKGKTTAAMGAAVRAAGNGLKVSVIQFLKGGGFTGEAKSLKKLGVEFHQIGPSAFNYTKKDIEKQRRGLKIAEQKVKSGRYDMVILDEILDLIWFKHAKESEIVDILKNKHPGTEIILTGHIKPKQIVRMADYVSEIKKIKHPFDKKIRARLGIEY